MKHSIHPIIKKEETEGSIKKLEKKRHSIRGELLFSFIGMTIAVLISTWVINNLFLENYYTIKKQNVLINTYNPVSYTHLDVYKRQDCSRAYTS